MKKVPDELHAALKARAHARGTSLNDLLLEMLRREMSRPSVKDWLTQVRDLDIRSVDVLTEDGGLLDLPLLTSDRRLARAATENDARLA